MSTEETRAIISRAMSIGMNNYELLADELLADDVVSHWANGDDHGREAWKKRQASFINAFDDLDWKIEASLADGSLATVKYTVTGIHVRELEGIPPTGGRITISGMTLIRVDGGKIVEIWAYPDRFGLVEQLGLRIR